MCFTAPRCVTTCVQADRQTDRQWGGSDRTELYLYIPVVILLPHREMTHFHCSVCVFLVARARQKCIFQRVCICVFPLGRILSSPPRNQAVAFTVREHERSGASLQIRGFVDSKHERTSASGDIAP